MAKKKHRLKIKPQTWRKWRRNPWLIRGFLVLLVLVGFGLGIMAVELQPYNQHPRNVVWAADKSVTIPADLVKFLEKRDDCKGYKGTDTPRGVGLWGVYQVSKARFAKISYGCSTDLTLYIMAVKNQGHWQLLQPTEYFSATGFLPKCSQIDRYQIDKSIEPYCIKDDGNARDNAIK